MDKRRDRRVFGARFPGGFALRVALFLLPRSGSAVLSGREGFPHRSESWKNKAPSPWLRQAERGRQASRSEKHPNPEITYTTSSRIESGRHGDGFHPRPSAGHSCTSVSVLGIRFVQRCRTSSEGRQENPLLMPGRPPGRCRPVEGPRMARKLLYTT